MKNNSCLVTPRSKSSCLVTHGKNPVFTTIARPIKEGIPERAIIIALSSESLDFKPFMYFYFVSRDSRTTVSSVVE